jgi:hypothetical protein
LRLPGLGAYRSSEDQRPLKFSGDQTREIDALAACPSQRAILSQLMQGWPEADVH